MSDTSCATIFSADTLIQAGANMSDIQMVELVPDSLTLDYQMAMTQANKVAQQLLGEVMLLSWYDRDREFESPQHSSECHLDSAIPGYVDYGISHGAKLMINFEKDVLFFSICPLIYKGENHD
jgi:hypothetical protein